MAIAASQGGCDPYDGLCLALVHVPLTVVVPQGEVMALRGQLRAKERMIHEMELAGGVMRPAGERGMPRALVPLEALHASERMREDAETARADVQASLVHQRLRHSACRLGFVGCLERERAEAQLLLVLVAWRAAAQQAQEARRSAERQAEDARRYAEQHAQLEHTSAQAAALEHERARLAALAAHRRATLPQFLGRLAEEQDALLVHSMLLEWRLAARQQLPDPKRVLLTAGAKKARKEKRGEKQVGREEKLSSHHFRNRRNINPKVPFPACPRRRDDLMGLENYGVHAALTVMCHGGRAFGNGDDKTLLLSVFLHGLRR
ncbi:hypothetical protein DUNSADRAFT_2730 [Dunaliella salina]|uniref:Uncharacterized protein n=1 Tax=Dunaliella salina TaxID=3046 RepID=A0ABQ7GV95_DUNSA|nr:hypothetical protein DUNSADRAFT_2730 [Dunaliella salina]|eukprot:KAF5838532.1 hypothetical protein DUNSADRAFT_2730 [Dunaliella salina]